MTATWPGSALLYRQMIQELRPEDFEIEYRTRNRFRFMGNGEAIFYCLCAKANQFCRLH